MTQLGLQVANLSWAAFARVHRQPLLLTLVVALETYAASGLLRGAGASALLVLLGSAGVVGVTLPGLIWALPRLFLGREGFWILETVSGYLPRAVRVQVAKLQYR